MFGLFASDSAFFQWYIFLILNFLNSWSPSWCILYNIQFLSLNHSFFLVGLWLLIFSVHFIGVLKLVERPVDRAAGGNGSTDPCTHTLDRVADQWFDEWAALCAWPEKIHVKVTLRGRDPRRTRLKLSTFWELLFLIVLSRIAGDSLIDTKAQVFVFSGMREFKIMTYVCTFL